MSDAPDPWLVYIDQDHPWLVAEHVSMCVLCDEPITRSEAWVPLNPLQHAHHECSMREFLGGIGHHIAHDYWCIQQHDTDAGLTRRQSAKMVAALIDVLGIEEVSRRSVVI